MKPKNKREKIIEEQEGGNGKEEIKQVDKKSLAPLVQSIVHERENRDKRIKEKNDKIQPQKLKRDDKKL